MGTVCFDGLINVCFLGYPASFLSPTHLEKLKAVCGQIKHIAPYSSAVLSSIGKMRDTSWSIKSEWDPMRQQAIIGIFWHSDFNIQAQGLKSH